MSPRAFTGMPPFVAAMGEGRYDLWRLRADDDDADDDDDRGGEGKELNTAGVNQLRGTLQGKCLPI